MPAMQGTLPAIRKITSRNGMPTPKPRETHGLLGAATFSASDEWEADAEGPAAGSDTG